MAPYCATYHNPRIALHRYGGPIDISTFKHLNAYPEHIKRVPLDDNDKEILKLAQSAFRSIKDGDVGEASAGLKGRRAAVAALLGGSDNPTTLNFIEKLTKYAKLRCQNVPNQAKFIIKLLHEAGLSQAIDEIGRSPHENIADLAARYSTI